MNTIDAARRLAQLGQIQEAQRAYALVLGEDNTPAHRLEGAVYILQSGGSYKLSYTALLGLYQEGAFRDETLEIMTGAFYQPNARALRARYDKNCKALAKYPYLFRKDFLPFDQLPIQFYPYDDSGYLPFHREEGRFDGYVDVKTPVVSRNFFADLDKPVLAGEVFSQYELEYLHDNVRPSEAVGRDNHVYLHYGDWGTFCAWLQVLDFRPLLKSRKFVLLVGPELEHYPINFQDRFQIDYSKYPAKPVSIREINRLNTGHQWVKFVLLEEQNSVQGTYDFPIDYKVGKALDYDYASHQIGRAVADLVEFLVIAADEAYPQLAEIAYS